MGKAKYANIHITDKALDPPLFGLSPMFTNSANANNIMMSYVMKNMSLV